MNKLLDFSKTNHTTSRSAGLNSIIIKEIKNYNQKNAPINSSKSNHPRRKTLDSEIQIARSHIEPYSGHLKKLSHDSQLLISLRSSHNLPSHVTSRRMSVDTQNYLSDTQSELNRQSQNFRTNKKLKNLLDKYSSLFNKLKKTEKSENQIFKAKNSKELKSGLLKSGTEKILHEEYLKDRRHLKNVAVPAFGKKGFWKHDCSKILRKVDKVLASIPKMKS